MSKTLIKNLALALTLISPPALALNLDGTVYERVANKQRLDPVLLYSISLAESAYTRGNGTISPWFLTLRSSEGARYFHSKAEAMAELEGLIIRHGARSSIDVGLMQVNLRWNGHRVRDPLLLLDENHNLEVGAEILVEALNSAPSDPELGVGRYHHWEDESVSRSYGRRVLSIYKQLAGRAYTGGPLYVGGTN